MKKIYTNFIACLLIIACFFTQFNSVTVLATDINNNISSNKSHNNRDIIITNTMTTEEINTIINENPGIIINPLINSKKFNVSLEPLVVTLVSKNSKGNFVLTATNVSPKATIVKNIFLVAQIDYETTTHKREKKAIQRPCGTLLPGQTVKEEFGGLAVFNHIYSITFFAYGTTATGQVGMTTPVVVPF